MAAKDKVLLEVSPDSEEAFFRKQEQELIHGLRTRTRKEADEKYQAEHRNHCFRCGTPSLVEVQHASVKMDICVNEGCGAVHLDPGELKQILKDHTAIKRVHTAVTALFK